MEEATWQTEQDFENAKETPAEYWDRLSMLSTVCPSLGYTGELNSIVSQIHRQFLEEKKKKKKKKRKKLTIREEPIIYIADWYKNIGPYQ